MSEVSKIVEKPIIYVDLDGVIFDFAYEYKFHFDRDVYKDDAFTINKFCFQVPHFFRYMKTIDKGVTLLNLLKDDYKVVFLTTPMEGMDFCRRDKINCVYDNFGKDYDVIFSSDKAEYVIDEKSILVDDMAHNLTPWREAGGTAINIRESIDRIFEIIEKVLYGREEILQAQQQLDDMDVEAAPTQRQKETGNYKKGKIQFKGMDIMIENPKGSIRFGFDESGKKWVQRMKQHYGYIKGTEGNDHDPVDCFIGDKLNASRAFIVNQGNHGIFDEVKCMLGFEDIESARKAYLSNYQKGWEKNIMSIVPTNTKKLREWLKLNSRDPFNN